MPGRAVMPPLVPDKWRPGLGLVLSLVLGAVMLLPLAGLSLLRISDGALMRQAEAELMAQGAALAAIAAREADAILPADAPLGPPVPESLEAYTPFRPTLDIAGPVRPPRPEAIQPALPAHSAFLTLGERLAPLLATTQRSTLAGFRLLDPEGRVIAGRAEVGMSLAEVPEVAEALRGHLAETLRQRISKHPDPPLDSWSRGTPIRVFIAIPIVARGQVAGVLYASRTPSGTLRSLYGQRQALGIGAFVVLMIVGGLGLVLHRIISIPVRDLVRLTTDDIGDGLTTLRPGRYQGTREFAALSRSFVVMAGRLTRRSDAIASFAAHVSHELKSPLSAMRGAAELLRDDLDESGMSRDERRRFIDNILADAARLDALLGRLREMARAEGAPMAGTTAIAPVLPVLRDRFRSLAIQASGDLDINAGLSAEAMLIALSHLADNAAKHAATALDIAVSSQGSTIRIEVKDDGTGIPPDVRARVFDRFFSTRRVEGGTGMGLAIVRATLAAYSGGIAYLDTEAGAGFVMTVPRAQGPVRVKRDTMGSRPMAFATVAAIVVAGLALRGLGPGAGLPFWLTKYGGSMLWGAMVYGLTVLAAPRASATCQGAVAVIVAISVESLRLLHAPELDAFRMSTAGALLLGRVFSVWNMVAYACGIASAAIIRRTLTDAELETPPQIEPDDVKAKAATQADPSS